MYIRCIDCRQSTWIEPVAIDSSGEFVCSGCSRTYTVSGSPELGSGARAQFRSALKLANRHDLDLPCAWSVLAGAMTLRQARACRSDMGLEQPDGAPAGEPRASGVASDSAEADEASVADETPALTSAPGESREEAQRLARQHDLPLSLARRVVRKEIKLAAALLLKPALCKPETEQPAEARPGPASDRAPAKPGRWKPRRRTAVIAAALALLAALWLLGPRDADEGDASQQRSVPADTEVQRDSDGRLVRIVGSDPEYVLIAYCKEESDRCEPLKLTLGSPPRAGLRLGIFRKSGTKDSLGAIEIRRQGQARRWVAGDGRAGIPSVTSPELAPGSVELPTRSL